MKILWIIPITLSDNSLMVDVKDRFANAVQELGHEIVTIVGYTDNRRDLPGFTDVTYLKIGRSINCHKTSFLCPYAFPPV